VALIGDINIASQYRITPRPLGGASCLREAYKLFGLFVAPAGHRALRQPALAHRSKPANAIAPAAKITLKRVASPPSRARCGAFATRQITGSDGGVVEQ